jgi:succinyl-diaminopimelate desuccinylase
LQASARMEATRRAQAQLDDECLADLLMGAIAIASPTGHEGELARQLVGELRRAGLEGVEQPIDDDRANALGTLRGSGDGPSLLLYSPIDTLTSGREDEDLPWAGTELRDDMRPRPVRHEGLITGLGAGNPKGHVACLIAAAGAIAQAKVPLSGDLKVWLCAGGMPTSGPLLAPGRRAPGHFFGCDQALTRGLSADYAVVAKPGWNVSYEEAGYAWIEIELRGEQAYAGSRHRVSQYRNPIHEAAALVPPLEAWFAEHAERHATEQVRPQAVIGAIAGGRPETLAITPATCRVWVDVRTSPAVSADEILTEVRRLTEAHVAKAGTVEASCRLVAGVPAVAGDASGRLVAAAIRAWEDVAGRSHEPPVDNSGASESNLLRLHGIETVKIGMPKPSSAADFQAGMNTAELAAMRDYAKLLIALAIDLCGSERDDG